MTSFRKSRLAGIAALAAALTLLPQGAGATPPVAPAADPAADEMKLDTATIKAHQGLPRVMTIVPWKRADDADLVGRPSASLLEEVLAPLDRAEFRRQLRYTQDLDAAASAPPTKP
jgi:hypothetical protein